MHVASEDDKMHWLNQKVVRVQPNNTRTWEPVSRFSQYDNEIFDRNSYSYIISDRKTEEGGGEIANIYEL